MRESEIIRLYDLYSDSVYRLAYSYTGSIQDSEDIVLDRLVYVVDLYSSYFGCPLCNSESEPQI